jgi:DNA-binding ferritin-like protein
MIKPTNYSLPHQSYEKINLQDKVNNYNESYYSSVPYSQIYNSNEKNKDLLNKLNYIISLLEEQKDEKTNNVIEEVILYTFLGIFIIFVIDSFAKASKYVR